MRGTTAGSSDDTDGDSNARAVPTIAASAYTAGAASHLRGAEQEHAGGQRLDALADRRDASTIVAVGHLPDDERQREHRHELREADETERERAVRERVTYQPMATDRIWKAREDMTRVPQKRWNGTWRNRLAGNGDKGLESGTESVIEVSAVGCAPVPFEKRRRTPTRARDNGADAAKAR